MKPILIAASVLASALVLFVSGMVAATMIYTSGVQPHQFAGLDTADLWTDSPVAIDKTKQSFPRIGAEVAEPDMAPSQTTTTTPDREQSTDVIRQNVAAVSDTQTAPTAEDIATEPLPDDRASSFNPEHVAWCQDRYRSYNRDDNSYRPYSGGLRPCVSPYSNDVEADIAEAAPDGSAMEDESSIKTIADHANDNENEASLYELSPEVQTISTRGGPVDEYDLWEHQERCFAMYRSYRPEDNSYQPYDGGPRRQCE